MCSSDLRVVDPAYGSILAKELASAGLHSVPMPYTPGRGAVGNYINYLRVGRRIVLPFYGLPADESASRVLESVFPDATILPCSAQGIARRGGVWNCVTWTCRLGTKPPTPIDGALTRIRRPLHLT